MSPPPDPHREGTAALCRLIVKQVPHFRCRPYLADVHGLESALADGLECSLEGEFCWSLCFSIEFIAALCFEGFLPICCDLGLDCNLFVLLPKLHAERCVMQWTDLHVPKKTRRHAKWYTLTVGKAFDAVVSRCIAQHGESWLHAPVRRGLSALAATRHEGACKAAAAAPRSTSVQIISFELWRAGELVAGEIGAAVGRSYTSFSGFHEVDNAGSVQIALTAKVLEAAGFAWWDMGQYHEYKVRHGARMLPRQAFLTDFRRERHRHNSMAEQLACHGNCFDGAAWIGNGAADGRCERASAAGCKGAQA